MSGRRWIIQIVFVGAVVVFSINALGTAIEPWVDRFFFVAGVLLLARACFLRFGWARPSRWGGYTSLGTFLVGIAAILSFGSAVVGPATDGTPIVEVLGAVALLSGVWIELHAQIKSVIRMEREKNDGAVDS